MTWTKTHVLCSAAFFLGSNGLFLVAYIAGHNDRYLKDVGWVFDLSFGVECAFNVLPALALIAALLKMGTPGTNDDTRTMLKTLKVFVVWNAGTTVLCYIGSIVLAKVRAAHIQLPERVVETAQKHQSSDEGLRYSLFILQIVTYSMVAGVKSAILYFMYDYGESVVLEEPPADQPCMFLTEAAGTRSPADTKLGTPPEMSEPILLAAGAQTSPWLMSAAISGTATSPSAIVDTLPPTGATPETPYAPQIPGVARFAPQVQQMQQSAMKQPPTTGFSLRRRQSSLRESSQGSHVLSFQTAAQETATTQITAQTIGVPETIQVPVTPATPQPPPMQKPPWQIVSAPQAQQPPVIFYAPIPQQGQQGQVSESQQQQLPVTFYTATVQQSQQPQGQPASEPLPQQQSQVTYYTPTVQQAQPQGRPAPDLQQQIVTYQAPTVQQAQPQGQPAAELQQQPVMYHAPTVQQSQHAQGQPVPESQPQFILIHAPVTEAAPVQAMQVHGSQASVAQMPAGQGPVPVQVVQFHGTEGLLAVQTSTEQAPMGQTSLVQGQVPVQTTQAQGAQGLPLVQAPMGQTLQEGVKAQSAEVQPQEPVQTAPVQDKQPSQAQFSAAQAQAPVQGSGTSVAEPSMGQVPLAQGQVQAAPVQVPVQGASADASLPQVPREQDTQQQQQR